MKNYKEKKFTMSKLIVIFTGLVFLLLVGFVVSMYLSGNINNTYDTTAIVTCITISGSIFGSNLCWYSKKAAGENHYKLRMSLYEESSKVRLEFNKEMIKLMKENNLTENDINRIDQFGNIDEMMDSALNDTVSELDNMQSEADASNQIENF